MPQTTDAISARNVKIEFSTNGTSWTDISGSANAIDSTEQPRMSGESYTASGDTAIVTGGKREPIELEIKIVYTETAGEAFEVVRAAHDSDGVGYLRWSPKGGTTGQKQYTTGKGVITGFTYPPIDTSSGDPILGGFKLKVPSITPSTIA
jgi:hypothetical protein